MIRLNKKVTIICGHYGCGKTNLSINLAMDHSKEGKKTVLVDLDLVNPYFRSSDYREMMEHRGIEVIIPVYAGTTLDVPAIAPQVYSVLDGQDGDVIFDVGGDDAGATVLGRLSDQIRRLDYEMLYVVNRYRTLTAEPEQAAALLKEIETASRLRATAVVNNSHLKEQTGVQEILNSCAFAEKTASLLGLPLPFTTVPRTIAPQLYEKVENIYPISIYVRSPWETQNQEKEILEWQGF